MPPLFQAKSLVDQPSTMVLDQNYPNPFNPTTTIPFELSQPMAINLELYDVLGRKIGLLIQNEFYGVGAHVIPLMLKGSQWIVLLSLANGSK